MALHEAQVDERLGIGVARHLAGRLPEGDLLINVADIEPPFGVDERQAGRNQRRRLLQHIGEDADHLLVTARAEGSERAEGGVTLLFVPKDAPGLRRQDYRLIDRRPVSDIWLDDVLVGADAVLSAPGDALPAVMTGLDHAVVALCADSVGAMDAALWMTRDYLRTRHQFGQPLANFQALQHRMADMLIETELARSMVYQGLHALTCEPDKRAKGASAAKVAVAKAGLFVGQQAIQLHGGMGMTEEYAVGHYYKRLFVNASLFGNIDFHAQRFAG